MIEIVRRNPGYADVRLFALSGHPRLGWQPEGRYQFVLPAASWTRLAAQIDVAMAAYHPPSAGPNGETVVCTDGPGWLTERVRGGAVTSLVGSCPLDTTENHPNQAIAAAVQDMLCRQRRRLAQRPYWYRRCFEPLLTMEQLQARGREQ